LQNREAVAVWQLEIQQRQVDFGHRAIERFAGAARLDDLVPLPLKPLAQRPANQRFVVDDENGGGCQS
jgi:hypothetical protein